MVRQAPVDESDDTREVQSVEDDSDGGSGTNEPQEVARERRSSTPVSVVLRNVPPLEDEEVQIMQLLQKSASAISSQASRVAEVDERKLRLEEGRIEREGEIEKRRIKVEEDREARLQRNEDRQAQMEEMRIASQKAQTEFDAKDAGDSSEKATIFYCFRVLSKTSLQERQVMIQGWWSAIKNMEVGDPSKQHLKLQSRQLASYHAPAGVRESTIFLGTATWEKYFLMSLKAHSTLTRTFDILLLKSASSVVNAALSNGVIRYGRRVYPESPQRWYCIPPISKLSPRTSSIPDSA
jgi:hypothetical protein